MYHYHNLDSNKGVHLHNSRLSASSFGVGVWGLASKKVSPTRFSHRTRTYSKHRTRRPHSKVPGNLAAACHRTRHTFIFWLCGTRTLVTAEPENAQAILTTFFDDFELGSSRRARFGTVIGNGIFAADGAQWSASRALLRPSFAKSRVDDSEIFEKHFPRFLQALPGDDGVAVDLHEFLECLTMDTIIDFLFGSSTDSLLNKQDTTKT